MLTIADPALSDPIEVTKMSMIGNPVADMVAASTSWMQNNTVMSIASPSEPLNKKLVQMLNGMTRGAS